MNEINGIGVSPGIAIGRARVIKKTTASVSGVMLGDETLIAAEIERFDQAVILAINEIENIKQNTSLSLTDDDIAILETQVELIGDPQIREDVTELISTQKRNATDALLLVTANTVELFKSMDDEYMRARSADVEDIGNRILKHLTVPDNAANPIYDADTIIIAEDISPSDTITMDLKYITGFATGAGGVTSHTAIIARSKALPAVVGCGAGLMAVQNGDRIIVDGTTGQVYVNPTPETENACKAKRELFIQHTETLKQLKDLPAVTSDSLIGKYCRPGRYG